MVVANQALYENTKVRGPGIEATLCVLRTQWILKNEVKQNLLPWHRRSKSYNKYIIAVPWVGQYKCMGKYSVLSLCIAPPCGRANTATLKLIIFPYCPPRHAISIALPVMQWASIEKKVGKEKKKEKKPGVTGEAQTRALSLVKAAIRPQISSKRAYNCHGNQEKGNTASYRPIRLQYDL